MKFVIFLVLFSSLKALDAEKSLAYFTPTGEYLPSADFLKLFPGTSERRPATVDDVKRVLHVSEGKPSPRKRREAKTPKNGVDKERKLKQLDIKSVGENVQITVDNIQEAKDLIKKFNKLGFTGDGKVKVQKKNKKQQEKRPSKEKLNSKKKSKKKIKIILVKNKLKK